MKLWSESESKGNWYSYYMGKFRKFCGGFKSRLMMVIGDIDVYFVSYFEFDSCLYLKIVLEPKQGWKHKSWIAL